MIEIRPAKPVDRDFWFTLDRHLPEAAFDRKVRDGQGYVLIEDGAPAALLRFNLFWDLIPFCTLLYVAEGRRGRGLGRALMARWEADMKTLGHGMVLTSTQVDETAQHFYRRLGYADAGGFTVTVPGYEQPLELVMTKDIRRAP